MEIVNVSLGQHSYDIYIGDNAFAQYAKLPAKRALVVTDSNLAPLIALGDFERFIFAAGEEHKTIHTVADICRHAARLNLDRKSRFIALGGGVTGDMTGFAAAIYMRGISFVQVPTTLLAMVDSSVGGKTAVDIPEGKNLIGAFHQPEAVLINPSYLQTLPGREIRCGLAEIVKTAVLGDAGLFDRLFQPLEWTPVIKRCCQIKADVVSKDEKENDLRAILNYGHTFGHAIESASNFTIGHGEAIAIGMNLAGRFALGEKMWSQGEYDRQLELLKHLELPYQLPEKFAPATIVENMRTDKKNSNGQITLVLPRAIGKVEVVKNVPESKILNLLGAAHA